MIDVVYLNSSKKDYQENLSRDEMKKVLGGTEEVIKCKTVDCWVAYGELPNGDPGMYHGDCAGDATHCYCDIGVDVGPVNSGGISHCTVGH